MKRKILLPFLMLILGILACTSAIQEEVERSLQETINAIIEEIKAEIVRWIEEEVEQIPNYAIEQVEPYVPEGFVNSVRWLFDEEVIDPNFVDPILSMGSLLSDYLELSTGVSSTSNAIPVANIVWSGANLINSGSRCLEQATSLLALSNKDCFTASLSVSGVAFGAAALLAAGTATAPVVITLGAAATALQFAGNFIKWE